VEPILKYSSTFKDLGDGKLELTASDESVDRDGDIIRAKGWDLKNYRKNPIVLFAHQYDSLPVAKAEKTWVEGDKLKSLFEFAPTQDAQDIYSLYKGGFLNAFSVGFIPTKWNDIPNEDPESFSRGREFTKQELLEISCVPVPSNPLALQNAMSKGLNVPQEMLKMSETFFEAQKDLEEVHTPTEEELEEIFSKEPPAVTSAEDTDFEEAEGGESEKDEPIADEKIGRVLNQANFDKLSQALDLLTTVIDSATPQDAVEPPKSETLEEPKALEPEAPETKAFDAEFLDPLKTAIPKLVSEMVGAEVRRLTGKVDD